MADKNVDNLRKGAEASRVGGRERAKPVTSGFSGDAATLLQNRNSSGNASHAASLLDLRQKVNYLFGVLEMICADINPEMVTELQSMRQRGFRRGA